MLFFIFYPFFFRNNNWMLPKWLYKLIVVLSVSVQSVWCTDPNMVHLQYLVPEGPPLVPENYHQIIQTQHVVVNIPNMFMQYRDQVKQIYIQEQDEINQPLQLPDFYDLIGMQDMFSEVYDMWDLYFRAEEYPLVLPLTSDIKLKEDTNQSSLLQSNLKFPKVFAIVNLWISLLLFPVCLQAGQLLLQKSFIDVSDKGRYPKATGKDYKEPYTDSILPCNSCAGVKPRTSVFVSKTIGTALTWTVSFASAIIGILQCAWIDALSKCSTYASETYKTALKQRDSFVISKDSDFSVKPSVFSFGKTLLGSDNFCRQHELWKFVPMPF